MSDCCHEPEVSGESGTTDASDRRSRDWFLVGVSLIVLVSYAASLLLPHGQQAGALATFSHGVFEIANKMWWGLALGVLFVGLLSRVPRDLVMAVLGHRAGFTSLLRATLAGVLLDLCSHGILAVGMKLYERGATLGQVMAFLLASPWNSLSLTLILIGLIGLGWTLAFIALSLVIGLVTGLVFDALVSRGTLPDNPHRDTLDPDASFAALWSAFRGSWRFSLAGTAALLKDGLRGARVVIRWGLFGILLAAAIRAVVPPDQFAQWFGASMSGLWLTLLAATVIEVCSEGTVPVAADLMNRAAAPGNAFTFLMAGVSTDYTEIMSIRDTTASWKIALFLPLVSLPQVLAIGFILNAV
ncbi:MAG: permease [Halieaceae bacterium]|nr:permease [Halieaceae bacterium]